MGLEDRRMLNIALENGRMSNKRATEFKSEVEQKVDRKSAGSGSTYNG